MIYLPEDDSNQIVLSAIHSSLENIRHNIDSISVLIDNSSLLSDSEIYSILDHNTVNFSQSNNDSPIDNGISLNCFHDLFSNFKNDLSNHFFGESSSSELISVNYLKKFNREGCISWHRLPSENSGSMNFYLTYCDQGSLSDFKYFDQLNIIETQYKNVNFNSGWNLILFHANNLNAFNVVHALKLCLNDLVLCGNIKVF